MRKQIKIQACSSPSIEDAFKDFLLHKKASGIAEKTLRSYSQQFSAVSKFIDSSVPIDQLVKDECVGTGAGVRDKQTDGV